LHQQSNEGHAVMVRCLLEKGADPTHKDRSGNNPLSRAILSKHK